MCGAASRFHMFWFDRRARLNATCDAVANARYLMPKRSFHLTFLVLSLTLAVGALAKPYEPPALHSMVEDPGHVLTAEQQAQLANRLGDFRKASGFAVVVFFPLSLEDQTVEDVAYQTFNRWKVGEAGKDNGVLLVLAVHERKVRIETGKGVGGQLTDIESGRILREQVIPNMKANQPYQAAVAGTDAIVAALGAPANAPVQPYVYNPSLWDRIKQWASSLCCLIFGIGFVYFLFTKGIRGGAGGGGGGGHSGGWGGGGSSGGGGSGSGGYSGGGGSSGGGGASGSY